MPSRTPAIIILLACLLPVLPAAAAPTGEDAHLAELFRMAASARPPQRRAVYLWRLYDFLYLSHRPSRERFDRLLETTRTAPGLPPALRRLATDLAARRCRQRGEERRARALWKDTGRLTRWLLRGPLPAAEGTAAARVEFPDLGSERSGPAGAVAWRPLPAIAADGRIDLEQWLPTQPAGDALLLAVVRAPRAVPALLWSGCQSSCRVWVNGRLVLVDDGLHPHGFDQAVAGLRLPAGPTWILARVGHQGESWRFSLAITDGGGRAIPGLEQLDPAGVTGRRLPRRRPGKPPPAPQTLAEWFAGRAHRRPAALADLAEAAFVLSRTQAYDHRQDTVEHLVAEAENMLADDPADVPGQKLLLLALATAEVDRALRLLAKIPAGAAAALEARWRRGLHYQVLNDTWRCWRLWRELLARAPGFLPARLGLVEALQMAELEGLARFQARQLARAHPDVPEVVLLAANQAQAAGASGQARQWFEKLWRLQRDDRAALRALLEMARNRGDATSALAWLERLRASYPARAGTWLERGRLLLQARRPAEAIHQFELVARARPWDAEPHLQLARALAERGQLPAARAALQRARSLRPNDKQLALLADLLAEGRERVADFYRRWQADARRLAARAGGDERLEQADGAGAVRLADVTVVKLHPGGAVNRFHQQVLLITNSRGAERLKTFQELYSPGRQQLQVLQARVLRRDGETDERVMSDDSSISEPWFNLYYDVHAHRLSFPSLRPGDVVEVVTLRTDVGNHSLLDGYFGDLVPVDFTEPARRVTYVLQAPAGTELYFHQPPGSEPDIQHPNRKTVVYQWNFTNRPPLRPEPNMPGYLDASSYLHVSTQADWPELSRWYFRHSSNQLTASRQVVKLARRLTRGRRRARDKIAALYRFVADDIRYVGLEFGVHSYLPVPASQVLAQRFGDCKDKSALLVSLLQAVGIPAQVVLVRAGSSDHIPPHPASLEVFNHALVHVLQPDTWLDATVGFHPPGQLPPQVQAVAALAVDHRGAPLESTPVSAPGDNLTVIRQQVALDPGGHARVRLDISLAGYLAPLLRAQLAEGKSPRQVMERNLAQIFPAASFTEAVASDVERLQRPLRLRALLDIDALARSTAGPGLEFAALGHPTSYRKLFAPFSRRETDLLLGPPWQVRWQVCYRPPAGFRAERLPAGGRAGDRHISAGLRFRRQEAGGLCAEATVTMSGSRVAADSYRRFRQALAAVDRLLATPVVLRAPGPGAGS